MTATRTTRRRMSKGAALPPCLPTARLPHTLLTTFTMDSNACTNSCRAKLLGVLVPKMRTCLAGQGG